MDSIKNTIVDKCIKEKICVAEYENDKFEDCKSDTDRTNFILNFFKFLKQFEISRRIREKTILYYDKTSKQQNFDKNFNKIFLLSLLNISMKLEKGSEYSKETIVKAIDSINIQKSQENEIKDFQSPDLKIYDINIAEIFMLNNLDWKINLNIFSDFTDFFIENYLKGIFNYVNKKSFNLFIDFFTDCTLSAFITNKIPVHTLAVTILILTLDQFKFCNDVCVEIVLPFMEICIKYYKIDLQRVENYKTLFFDYMERMNIKITKVYPDYFIHLAFENNNNEGNLIKNINLYTSNYTKFNSDEILNGGGELNSNYSTQNTQRKYQNIKTFDEVDLQMPFNPNKNIQFLKSKEYEEDSKSKILSPCIPLIKKSSSFNYKNFKLI